jgi:hypothetical protein
MLSLQSHKNSALGECLVDLDSSPGIHSVGFQAAILWGFDSSAVKLK